MSKTITYEESLDLEKRLENSKIFTKRPFHHLVASGHSASFTLNEPQPRYVVCANRYIYSDGCQWFWQSIDGHRITFDFVLTKVSKELAVELIYWIEDLRF